MAHLWNQDDSGDWVATAVGEALASQSKALGAGVTSLDEVMAQEQALLRRLANPHETWAVLCPPRSDVRVNGEPVPLGLAILSDRDELRVPGRPVRYFSTETIARVERYPGTTGGGFCPRCKQPIESGSAAVRCPACGLWHHSAGELQCWTYGPTCAGCAQDTAMDAGFRWTPEDL